MSIMLSLSRWFEKDTAKWREREQQQMSDRVFELLTAGRLAEASAISIRAVAAKERYQAEDQKIAALKAAED